MPGRIESVCLGLILGVCGAIAVGAQRTGGSKNAVTAPAAAPARATSYKVVQDRDVQQVEARVKQMLAEGWEPVGGVAYTPPNENGPGSQTYLQAMIGRE